jgi:D-alanyl-D-alanine carboxypeptidase
MKYVRHIRRFAVAVDVATLYKEFNKSEIIEIAKELELETKVTQSAKVMTNMILDDLNDEGVPEECSELMNEFLYVAGYIDDDGDLLEEEEDEQIEDVSTQVDEVKEAEEVDQKPDCFTFADERDPACKKCKLVRECVLARVDNRPLCFGQFFDDTAEECKVCIEAPLCSQAA